MAIDGEPRDGDYVRYIEQLINRGQAAPGQVVAGSRDALGAPRNPPSPGEVMPGQPAAARGWGTTRGDRDRPASAPAPGARGAGASTEQTTLAAQAAKRRGAWAVVLVSLAIAWQAIRMPVASLRQPDFDPHELVPVAFLLIFAGLLWKAARSQRARAKQPPARLPPLTTIAGKDKAGL